MERPRPGAVLPAAWQAQRFDPPQGASMSDPMQAQLRPAAAHKPVHFAWEVSADARVATITLNRPERKNPLTFESYAELRDLFRDLAYAPDVKCVVIRGAGDNFC